MGRTLGTHITTLTRTHLDSTCHVASGRRHCTRISIVGSRAVTALLTRSRALSRGRLNRVLRTVRGGIIHDHMLTNRPHVSNHRGSVVHNLSIHANILPHARNSTLFAHNRARTLIATALNATHSTRILSRLVNRHASAFLFRCGFPPCSMNRANVINSPGHHRVNRNHLTGHNILTIVPSVSGFPCAMHIISRVARSGNSSSVTSIYNTSLTLVSTNIPVGTTITNVTVNLIGRNSGCIMLSSVLNSRSRLNSVSFGITNSHSNVSTLRVSVGVRNVAGRVVRITLGRTGNTHLRVLNMVRRTVGTPHNSVSRFTPHVRAVGVGPSGVGSIVNGNNSIVHTLARRANAAVRVRSSNAIGVTTASNRGTGRTVHHVRRVATRVRINHICANGIAHVISFNTFITVNNNGRNLMRVSRVTSGHIRGIASCLRVNRRMPIGILRISHRNHVHLDVGRTARRSRPTTTPRTPTTRRNRWNYRLPSTTTKNFWPNEAPY